jgi:maltose-binding protein MalE
MSKKLIFIIIIILVLGGAMFFLLNKNTPQQNPGGAENEIPGQEQTFNITPSNDNAENSIYTDSQYKFSFEYPKDFTVTKFQEGEDGDTILVQEKESKKSFQIFISPFDEPGPLTKERVLEDLPDLIIKNPEQRVLKNGVPALIFFSEEASLGETREIWFVHNGFLYQISTYATLDNLVAKIMETWKFQ